MVRFDNLIDVDEVLGAVGLCRKSEASGMGTFFVGLGLGLIGGAAAAFLLTPYSGTETREKLLRASEDIGRTVTEKVTELSRTIGVAGEHSPQVGPGVGTQGGSFSHGTGIGTV